MSAACSYGAIEVASELILHGADVNAVSDEGESALMEVTMSGEWKVVCLLLDHGAKSELSNNKGQTALIKAACRRRS